ncbi:hypothetical protein BGZ94_003978, partial [Podila epigama]
MDSQRHFDNHWSGKRNQDSDENRNGKKSVPPHLPEYTLRVYIPSPHGQGASEPYVTQNEGHSGPSSPFQLQALSPCSPLTPGTPAYSPTGKRYVDTRRRKKFAKRNEKQALRTAVTLFSNERTFIHWIKFGMLLGALAMVLLNFAGTAEYHASLDPELVLRAQMIGMHVGVALLVICLLCLVYAALTFHWRHLGVAKNKNDNRYFDRWGPTLLTIGLFIAYSINVFLTIAVTNKLGPDFTPTIFYNGNNNDIQSNDNVNMTVANQTLAPAQPIYVQPHPVFETPQLPTGSTILVENEEKDKEESKWFSDTKDGLVRAASDSERDASKTDYSSSPSSSPSPSPSSSSSSSLSSDSPDSWSEKSSDSLLELSQSVAD